MQTGNLDDQKAPAMDLALALRARTAAAHEAIEHLPVMRRLTSNAVTLADYRHYLSVMAEVYAPVEAALYEQLDPGLCDRFGLRPKLPALQADLDEQHLSWRRAAMAGNRSEESTQGDSQESSEAIIGGLYVLEGATLGGRTIARQLRRLLGPELGGLRFLEFHADQTPAAWKHFTSTLNALCSEGALDAEKVIDGALATFAKIREGLDQAESV